MFNRSFCMLAALTISGLLFSCVTITVHRVTSSAPCTRFYDPEFFKPVPMPFETSIGKAVILDCDTLFGARTYLKLN